VRFVRTDSRNAVLVAVGPGQRGRPIREVRADTQVDDDLLKAMDEAGLIQSYTDLGMFRRLPDHARIRLTERGREYLPA
jgi:hypothetical protein